MAEAASLVSQAGGVATAFLHFPSRRMDTLDMERRLDFRFEIPPQPAGPLVELSLEETEALLLKKLAEAKEDRTKALWQLAQFYKLAKQHEKALERLRELIQLLPDPESKAECIFTMGQAMEQVGGLCHGSPLLS